MARLRRKVKRWYSIYWCINVSIFNYSKVSKVYFLSFYCLIQYLCWDCMGNIYFFYSSILQTKTTNKIPRSPFSKQKWFWRKHEVFSYKGCRTQAGLRLQKKARSSGDWRFYSIFYLLNSNMSILIFNYVELKF